MKKKKKKKKKPSKKEIRILLVMSVLFSAAMFYSYFSEDTQETSAVRGVFDAYEETKRGVNKSRKTYRFVILNGIKYNIPMLYIKAFNKEDFLAEVKKGDSLTLTIKGNSSVYQITKGDTHYIDPHQLKEEVESNSFVGLILGSVFSVISVLLLYAYVNTSK